ncbi:MAG: DUF1934 domain-containing protein [Oscillospiraceae bacterium]
MKKQVMISVRGEQYYEGVDPDETELLTEGTLEQTPDGWLLSYEESELTGMEGTTTTFAIGEGEALLRRVGTIQSEMYFKPGEISTSAYDTPYGTLTVEIGTRFLRAEMSRQGGELEIRYSIAVEHQVTGENRFLIKVKELDAGGETI